MAYFMDPMSEEFRKAVEEAVKELEQDDRAKKKQSKRIKRETK